ncbi:MAG: hypothetical protein KTQ49_07050, partial [Candidatus Omnitrophica bacterium]|nr:hypothetical protein [Candidatus Omnitrophota bacterium]
MTDLIRGFPGRLRLNTCFFKKKSCPNRGTCLLKREIDQIERDALRRLGKIHIAFLTGKGQRS